MARACPPNLAHLLRLLVALRSYACPIFLARLLIESVPVGKPAYVPRLDVLGDSLPSHYTFP